MSDRVVRTHSSEKEGSRRRPRATPYEVGTTNLEAIAEYVTSEFWDPSNPKPVRAENRSAAMHSLDMAEYEEDRDCFFNKIKHVAAHDATTSPSLRRAMRWSAQQGNVSKTLHDWIMKQKIVQSTERYAQLTKTQNPQNP